MLDLHFHSKLSDGRKDNQEIIQIAQEKGLQFIACTDHDFINSEFPRLANSNGIASVEAVEISGVDETINKHLHLTCYAKHFSGRIINILEDSREMKQKKLVLQIDLLVSNGFTIDYQEFYNYFEAKGIKMDNLNSGHIAMYIFKFPENLALIKKMIGEEITTGAFIQRFLKREGDFGYIGSITLPEYEPNIKLLGELAKENNAILSVAHPNFKFTEEQFKSRILSYLEDGVNAIEINTRAKPEWVKLILEYKQKYGFLITFGSDCHFKKTSDSKHGELGEINPLLDSGMLNIMFGEFKSQLGV